jgi:hypothetical protein
VVGKPKSRYNRRYLQRNDDVTSTPRPDGPWDYCRRNRKQYKMRSGTTSTGEPTSSRTSTNSIPKLDAVGALTLREKRKQWTARVEGSSRRHVTPACWLRSLTSVVEADLWRDRMRNLAATPFLSCFALMGMQPCMCCEILF